LQSFRDEAAQEAALAKTLQPHTSPQVLRDARVQVDQRLATLLYRSPERLHCVSPGCLASTAWIAPLLPSIPGAKTPPTATEVDPQGGRGLRTPPCGPPCCASSSARRRPPRLTRCERRRRDSASPYRQTGRGYRRPQTCAPLSSTCPLHRGTRSRASWCCS